MSDGDHTADSRTDPSIDSDGTPKQSVINRRTLLTQLGSAGVGMGLFSGQVAATNYSSASDSDLTVRKATKIQDPDTVASYTNVALSEPTAPLVDVLEAEESLQLTKSDSLAIRFETDDVKTNLHDPTLVILPYTQESSRAASAMKGGFLTVLVLKAERKKIPAAALAVAGEPTSTTNSTDGGSSSGVTSVRMYGTRDGAAVKTQERTAQPAAVSSNQVTTNDIGTCFFCKQLLGEICSTGIGGGLSAACLEYCLVSTFAYFECLFVCEVFVAVFSFSACGKPASLVCEDTVLC